MRRWDREEYKRQNRKPRCWYDWTRRYLNFEITPDRKMRPLDGTGKIGRAAFQRAHGAVRHATARYEQGCEGCKDMVSAASYVAVGGWRGSHDFGEKAREVARVLVSELACDLVDLHLGRVEHLRSGLHFQ